MSVHTVSCAVFILIIYDFSYLPFSFGSVKLQIVGGGVPAGCREVYECVKSQSISALLLLLFVMACRSLILIMALLEQSEYSLLSEENTHSPCARLHV